MFQRGVHPGYIFVDHNKSLDNRNIIADFLSLYRRVFPRRFQELHLCTILSIGIATLDESRAAQPTTGPESEAARESTRRGRT